MNILKAPLELQYRAFNTCFWTMLIIATVVVLLGSPVLATLLATLGLVSGAIGQIKLLRIELLELTEKVVDRV